LERWKRNLAAAWVSQLLCVLGFNSVFAFLPLYIQGLGVTDPDQVKLWTGWISTGGQLSMAIMAPIWGALADRYGRKMMVQRAAFSGAVFVFLIGLSTNVTQVMILRTLQGVFSGVMAAFVTLVASTTPRGKEGFSMGMMQMAVYSGSTVAPLIGGLLADAMGFRATFYLSSAMLILGGLVAWRFTEENFVPSTGPRRSFRSSTKDILSNKVVVSMTVLVAAIYFTGSVVMPMLPLFVQELEPTTDRLATITGAIQAAGALTSAIAAALIGRLSDRVGHRRMLVIAGIGMALVYIPMMFVRNSMQLLLLNGALGLFLGGLMPASNALIALNVKRENQGATYGLTASAGAAGRAIAPLFGSMTAVSLGIRSLFPMAAALYAAIALWVRFNVPEKRPEAEMVTEAAATGGS
jgi:DHA1 family multidrug resistance protein-like MFS transporter